MTCTSSRSLGAGSLFAFLLVLATLLAAGAGQAAAQENPHQRDGFWINAGLGYGSLSLENLSEREEGLSGNLALGGTLSPRFLLGGGVTGWTKEVSGVRIDFSTLLLLGRFYPSATGGFFMTAGLGAGQVSVSEGSMSLSDSGGGALLGLGYDARIATNWSITLFANAIGFSIEDERADVFQFGAGFTFH